MRLLPLLCLIVGLLGAPLAYAEKGPKQDGYVFGVTVNTAEQLEMILSRAEDLRSLFNSDDRGKVSIVLHGNELQLFQKMNYSSNQSLVDRARLLDEDNIIDIKACQTKMRSLHIKQSELPSFIEQVPFAPVEIDRLVREEGFTRL
ncbi:MAG: intracellular sulfur oxidation DsrE/DsrF family protein [Planctomycetota bacterium]|jgi:intracellular sulfur oxidation DsrE/DsrF family protein